MCSSVAPNLSVVSGVTRRPVRLQCWGRALLGHRVKRPGGLTVMRRHWAPLACPRITDAVRRLRVAVVAPESFVKVSVRRSETVQFGTIRSPARR